MLRHTARLLAAALLFAQALTVAQACVEADARPAMAFEESDCHRPANPNDCLQQCTAGDQSSSYAQVVVAGMPGLAVLTVPVARDHGTRPDPTVLFLAHSPDPPTSIRFCSFQI
jgi:hypothetical protein